MTKQIITLASQVFEQITDITASLESQLDDLTGTRYIDSKDIVWEIESIDVDYIDVIKYNPDAMEHLTTFTIEIDKHEKVTCITGSNDRGDREYDSLKVFPKEIQNVIYKAIPLASEMNRATLISYEIDVEGLEALDNWSESDEADTMEKADCVESFHTFEAVGGKSVCFIRVVNGVEALCYESSYDQSKYYFNGEVISKDSFDPEVLKLIDLVKYCYNIR